jgi:hypothetical protein
VWLLESPTSLTVVWGIFIWLIIIERFRDFDALSATGGSLRQTHSNRSDRMQAVKPRSNQMSCTIGYSPRKEDSRVWEITVNGAREALKTVLSLRATDEAIRYIKLNGDYDVAIRELEMYAEQEK